MATHAPWLSQDFRTGYYTLTSPRSLVAAQLVGAFIGVLFAPGVYAFYTHSFNVGVDYEYSVPYAKVRNACAWPLGWLHFSVMQRAATNSIDQFVGCFWSFHRLRRKLPCQPDGCITSIWQEHDVIQYSRKMMHTWG